MTYVRKACLSDVEEIMHIIEQGRSLLAKEGIPQWTGTYPSRDLIEHDIRHGVAYVLVFSNQVAGFASMIAGVEAYYNNLHDGSWANEDPYCTIHRFGISPDFKGNHLGEFFFSGLVTLAYAEGIKNVRADTHDKNARMKYIMEKQGFVKRGYVEVPDDETDPKRIAFELNLK